ncbi:MAG: hypothetical protein HEP71_24265 [Roseivirga sp.]|nr:hypothetical protein [Roseivirga sp.]
MKKTLLALGTILAVAIACQVNNPDTQPEVVEEATKAPLVGPVYSVVEETAVFPGGKDAWNAFISENLITPDNSPQGRVYAAFVVDKAGVLHDIKLIRGIGGGADEAVVALLEKSPSWQAGKQRGEAVNSKMVVAVQFGEAEAGLETSAPQKPINYEEIEEVFTVVEEQATFPGGTEAWARFIDDNLKTPDSNVKGRVFATFVVDRDGALKNIQLIRGIGGGADEAVIELLKNSPNWIAGKQRGNKVNSQMQVAITFK